MSQFQFTRYNYLPPVIKNLMIINVLMYIAELVRPELIVNNLSLYYIGSPNFKPVQIITHMFMHDPNNFAHILFNMLALWMFGTALENFWGSKRFLIFYLITGFGAVFLHQIVEAVQLYNITGSVFAPSTAAGFTQAQIEKIQGILFSPTLGASGAIFGVLVAFGMLFPNTMIYVYFLLPIKAKYFVIIYIAIELYMGFLSSPTDNVAHFAHLGGALFGFLLVKYWNRSRRNFY